MEDIIDGVYEVIVISADEASEGVTTIDVAFTSGALKGASTTLRSSMPIDRALSMLGLPATLHVEEGRPRLVAL